MQPPSYPAVIPPASFRASEGAALWDDLKALELLGSPKPPRRTGNCAGSATLHP